jgi:uncharacterized membrane protein YcfT
VQIYFCWCKMAEAGFSFYVADCKCRCRKQQQKSLMLAIDIYTISILRVIQYPNFLCINYFFDKVTVPFFRVQQAHTDDFLFSRFHTFYVDGRLWIEAVVHSLFNNCSKKAPILFFLSTKCSSSIQCRLLPALSGWSMSW